MNVIQKISVALASIAAVAVFALPQANPTSTPIAGAVIAQNVQPLTSPETPQALQWDMTYGDLTPPWWVTEAASR